MNNQTIALLKIEKQVQKKKNKTMFITSSHNEHNVILIISFTQLSILVLFKRESTVMSECLTPSFHLTAHGWNTKSKSKYK